MKLDPEFLKSCEKFFGDPEKAEGDLIAVGGKIFPEILFYAYSHGIFPWSERPARWYSVNPRAVFDLDGLHISRTVRKKIRKKIYKITFNKSFQDVMKKCAERKKESTWITPGFLKGYSDFHDLGYAHSAEAWDEEGNLSGGVYGVAIGRFFAGESMFSSGQDAGKIALACLFNALKNDGFTLFDSQVLTEVTFNLGAYEISRPDYLQRLKVAVKIPYKWTVPDADAVYADLLEVMNRV